MTILKKKCSCLARKGLVFFFLGLALTKKCRRDPCHRQGGGASRKPQAGCDWTFQFGIHHTGAKAEAGTFPEASVWQAPKPSRDQDGTHDTAWPKPRACFQKALLEQFKPRRCWRQGVREGQGAEVSNAAKRAGPKSAQLIPIVCSSINVGAPAV